MDLTLPIDTITNEGKYFTVSGYAIYPESGMIVGPVSPDRVVDGASISVEYYVILLNSNNSIKFTGSTSADVTLFRTNLLSNINTSLVNIMI